MDNIGGFQKVELIQRNYISLMYEVSGITHFVLKEDGYIIDIPLQQGGNNSITAEPDTSDAGTVYNNEATLYIPRQYMIAELQKKIEIFCIVGGVIRYTTNNYQTFIIGTDQYPLQAELTNLQPGEASGFSGYRLHLSGKSINTPLRY
jgi:hypothetical protein